jgi:predicted nucleic acid-binding protein
MTTFVDTNVIIYLLDSGSPFHDWAKAAAIKRRTEGPLIISDIVYSELSVDLQSVDATDEVINLLALERIGFTRQALFRAGRAFTEYRERGGPKTNVLSDFLIGAQAETAAAPLLTNNRKDFISYFPSVELITPTTAF